MVGGGGAEFKERPSACEPVKLDRMGSCNGYVAGASGRRCEVQCEVGVVERGKLGGWFARGRKYVRTFDRRVR